MTARRTTPCQTDSERWTGVYANMEARRACWGCWRLQDCAADAIAGGDMTSGMHAGVFVRPVLGGTTGRAAERRDERAERFARLRAIVKYGVRGLVGAA